MTAPLLAAGRAARGSAAARGTASRRIALFGGSFNPPHAGHVDLVRTLLERELADEVRVVPVYEHPFGKPLAPYADRLEMCRLAFRGLGERVRVSDIERDLGGTSYTVRTLEELRRAHPDARLLLVLGADALREREQWRDFDRIRELAALLVVPRQGEPAAPEALAVPPPAAVSSTAVRARLARGEDTTGLLDREVDAYARERALYRAEPLPTGGER